MKLIHKGISRIKFAGVPLISRAFIKWLGEYAIFLYQIKALRKCSREQLVDVHFLLWASEGHSHVANFKQILCSLPDNPTIVETGSAAWGIASSRLFDRYVTKFGGNFFSVDIRKEASDWLIFQYSKSRTNFFTSDSVEFLSRFLPARLSLGIDLVYLDSMDLDLRNPLACAQHGLEEFLSVEVFLKSGSYILIDDSPNSIEHYPETEHSIVQKFYEEVGAYPGKGSLIEKYIRSHVDKYEILFHNYQLCLRVR